MGNAREDAKEIRMEREENEVEHMGAINSTCEKYKLKWTQCVCAWLACMTNWLNGTVLLLEEFQDNLQLRYGLMLLGPPKKCDACSDPFTC